MTAEHVTMGLCLVCLALIGLAFIHGLCVCSDDGDDE